MSLREEAHKQRTRQPRLLREEAYTATYTIQCMENHKIRRKSNIDVDNVDTKTLIQEVYTTIGQTMSLREEAHKQRTRQTRLLREKCMEIQEKKTNIDVDDVDTKTLIKEAHTTIGKTISLREEAHIQ